MIGTNVILGMGNFSAIFRIRGLSKESESLSFLGESIILVPTAVIIIIIAIRMSRIFRGFWRLAELDNGEVGGVVVSGISCNC